MIRYYIRKSVFCVFLSVVAVTATFAQSRAERDAIADKKAMEIVARVIKPRMTDFEKVLVLHEYITDRVTYGKLDGKTDAYTALLHNQADCVGFARGLHALFKAAGLDSFVVVRKKGHLWVKVNLHGDYYNIDPTWCAVKSNWRQYGWFLLSDEQNIDTQKGAGHILDSGEQYPPAPKHFVFKGSDYVNKDLLRCDKKLRVMGTISLPKGQVAPQGGILGDVNGNRFHIPEGEQSAFYITSIPRDTSDKPVVKARVTTDSSQTYAKEAFYSVNKLVLGLHNAEDFPLDFDDITGADFTLIPGKIYMQGKVGFPRNESAPSGGVYISVELTGYRGRDRFRYYDRVYIPEGESSASYHIDVDENDRELEFRIYYFSSRLERLGYQKLGYYAKDRTVPEAKDRAPIYFTEDTVFGIDLEFIR
jgi:hypothetical protein